MTTTVLCMKRIGGSSSTVIGGVEAATGSSAARSSASVVSGEIGPIPDEPLIVMCGGSSATIRGSNRCWISRRRSAMAPWSSTIVMMPGFMNVERWNGGTVERKCLGPASAFHRA